MLLVPVVDTLALEDDTGCLARESGGSWGVVGCAELGGCWGVWLGKSYDVVHHLEPAQSLFIIQVLGKENLFRISSDINFKLVAQRFHLTGDFAVFAFCKHVRHCLCICSICRHYVSAVLAAWAFVDLSIK